MHDCLPKVASDLSVNRLMGASSTVTSRQGRLPRKM